MTATNAMIPATQMTPERTALNEIRQLLLSYHRDGLARNLRPLHLRKRHRQLVAFFTWLQAQGALPSLAEVKSDHIKAYLTHLQDHLKASSIKNKFLILHA